MERLRCLLASAQADIAYASPSRRALATAVALPDRLLEPVQLQSLQEIDCGHLDGWLLSEIKERFPGLWSRNLGQEDDTFRWPGGESYEQFRDRVVRAARAIAGRHCGERVLAFTHSGFISQLLGCLAGLKPAEWEQFRPGNASITEVNWDRNGNASVVRYDDRGHLHGLKDR